MCNIGPLMAREEEQNSITWCVVSLGLRASHHWPLRVMMSNRRSAPRLNALSVPPESKRVGGSLMPTPLLPSVTLFSTLFVPKVSALWPLYCSGEQP